MSVWDTYPSDYRAREVQSVVKAVQAGECVSVIGLSGAGKSNFMGFLAHRSPLSPFSLLVDCNRLSELSAASFFQLVRRALGEAGAANGDELSALEAAVTRKLAENAVSPAIAAPRLCLLLDRFDTFETSEFQHAAGLIATNLRALRDDHKYELTYVTATRRPLTLGRAAQSELVELFYAHTLWLGPLSLSDAEWSAGHYAARQGLNWTAGEIESLYRLSGGYPSLLRACSEAYAAGCSLSLDALRKHDAVQRRLDEFWADQPSPEALQHSGLAGNPLLLNPAAPQLTAKEHLLLEYFRAHPQEVCEKDDLIRAVWPEDKIFERGVRDDSLAQLIRRLREKIETDASSPRRIHTVPGRGYRYTP